MHWRCPACSRRVALKARCPDHPDVRVDAAPAPQAEAPPAIFGLRITGLIGRGGFASVYMAELAREGGRIVAVKVAHGPGDERMAREAHILGLLDGEAAPGLIAAGATGDGRPYLIMEYLAGGTLADRMAARPGPVSLEEVGGAVLPLCAAVTAMHGRGVVHRDLKPENLGFRSPGQGCVLDLGLAAIPGNGRQGGAGARAMPRLTLAGQWLGTPEYMAPETWQAPESVDRRADVYALGIIIYELLVGRPPFVGDEAAVRHGHVFGRCPLPSAARSLPRAVDEVVLRCLAKEPAARWHDAGELAAELGRALRETPAAAPRPERPAGNQAEARDARPMAVLWLELDAPVTALAASARAHDAVVARSRANNHVLALPWAVSPAAGVRAAVALAEELVRGTGPGHGDAGPVRAVVGVAALRVRRHKRGALVLGQELDRRPPWPAGIGEPGPLLTREAAELLDGHERGEAVGALVRVRTAGDGLAPVDARTVALGFRDKILDELVHELSTSPGPGLITVLGDAGMGKSRVMDALCERLAAAGMAPVRWEPANRAGEGAPAERTAAARAVARALVASAPDRVVLVDNGHALAPAVLDGIELAVASHGITVCMAARPLLLALRPRWGNACPQSRVHVLAPLTAAASAALVRAILHPVELVPRPVAEHIHELAGGVPGHVVDLALAVRAGGAVRRDADMDGYYLAADAVEPAIRRWLGGHPAATLLDQVPAPLVPLVQVCAVAGAPLAIRDVTNILDELERCAPELAGRAGDPAAGLERLVELDMLGKTASGYGLAPVLCRAVEQSMAATTRRRVHAAVLAHVLEHAADDPVRLARHGAGAGNAKVAVRALLRLAETARATHGYVAAEQHYSAALAWIAGEDEALLEQVLAGRGSVHYRLQRFADALADIRRACTLAARRGDEAARLALLFEEAKVLHWCQDSAAEAEVTARACAGLAALVQAPGRQAAETRLQALGAAADLARARLCYRRQEFSEAIVLLERAAAAGDDDTRAGALLLLGPALVYSGQPDEAEARFAAIIDLCRRAGDSFYLATAYLNRPGMWIKRGRVDAAAADLEQCIALAQELGNAQLERAATFNLAELLYWHGRLDRARDLAERCRTLVLQYLRAYRPYEDHLLLARIACARGEPAAGAHLQWIETHCDAASLPPSAQTLAAMVRLGAAALASAARDREPDDNQAAWLALARSAAENALLEEHIEVMVVAAEVMTATGHGARARSWLAQARAAANDSALWQPRLAQLSRKLA